MKELFKTQLENNALVTEDILAELNNKYYYNGDPIEIGDKLLFAFAIESDISDDDNPPMCSEPKTKEIKIDLVVLNESHFDLYEVGNSNLLLFSQGFPVIKLKNVVN